MSNTFGYFYDRLNRLTSGVTADSAYAERNITYDQAGNIQTLSRVYGGDLTDSLVYHYTKNAAVTNQVQTIQDLSADLGTTCFAAGTGTYHYDPNGNMNTFSSTNPAAKTYSTTYNLLNLPNLVHSTVNSVYEYDANGEKLSRLVDTNETDYIGGIQYDNNHISFIQTEEGRVFPYSTDTSNYYEYYLADHLGNSRIAFDTPHDTLKVEQQDDYLPFGMEISQGTVANPKNEYLYNKKELQENTQLYDYGARFYDPVIARWNIIDPLAEKNRRWTPYNYVENNPIRLIDPDGMGVDDPNKPTLITVDKKALKTFNSHTDTYSDKTVRPKDNIITQFIEQPENFTTSVSQTSTTTHVGTLDDFATGNKTMVSTTTATTTTVSMNLVDITGATQTSSTTTVTTPIASENKTSAVLDVSATKVTTSLPVTKSLSLKQVSPELQ